MEYFRLLLLDELANGGVGALLAGLLVLLFGIAIVAKWSKLFREANLKSNDDPESTGPDEDGRRR